VDSRPAARGKHRAAPLPRAQREREWARRAREWARRPREPVRLDDFRLVLLVVGLGPATLVGGVQELFDGEARSGLCATVPGLLVTAALVAYARRPVREDPAGRRRHWDP